MAGDEFAEPFTIIGIGTVVDGNDQFVDRLIRGFADVYYETGESCDIDRDRIYDGSSAPGTVANPYNMLPENPRFYQYLGSQTFPPCTQNVFWNYLQAYAGIGDRQNSALRTMILERLDPLSCRFDTVADPDTGSTARPPLDPGNRPISLTGHCQNSP